MRPFIARLTPTVFVIGLLAGVLWTGCQPPATEEQQAVVNGATSSNTDRAVWFTYPEYCTGTPVTNSWILTAAHCFGSDSNPAHVEVVHNGTLTYGVPNLVFHPTLDYALVELSSPLTINGSTTGFKSLMYTYSGDSLSGKAVQLQGFGATDCGRDGIDGTLRYGNFSGSYGIDQYTVSYAASNGVSAGGGDSGGPMWLTYRSLLYQTGVLKSGGCGNFFEGRPENFEPWVFAVIYGAPIPIPTTNHLATVNGWSHASGDQNQGSWFVAKENCTSSPCNINMGHTCTATSQCPGNATNPNIACWNGQCVDQSFWQRPLPANANRSTWSWNPCQGYPYNYYRYTIDYSVNAGDQISVTTAYDTQTFTGTNDYWAWGLGNMSIAYSTGSSGTSPGVNFMNVQCCNKPGSYNTCYDTAWEQQNEHLVCHGGRCGNTVDPIPQNFYQVVTWDPCSGGSFRYYLNYSTVYPDNIWIQNGGDYYGTGQANGVYEAGPVQISIATDPNTMHYSHGIRSLTAVCTGW